MSRPCLRFFNKKIPTNSTFCRFIILLAEGEGFEPSNRLLRYTRSRRASSTTPAPFLVDNYTTTLLPLMVALTDIHSL